MTLPRWQRVALAMYEAEYELTVDSYEPDGEDLNAAISKYGDKAKQAILIDKILRWYPEEEW